MTLRILAGEFRGRKLNSTRGAATRPLRSAVREALFNVLGEAVDGAEVWDLFAGTGASGIEALSRGARHVTFLEKSNSALAVLRSNLELVDTADRATVVKADAWSPEFGERGPDLVFLDPPYATVAEDPVRAACRAAQMAEQMAPGGVLCFHFEEGLLDADDFDHHLDVDLRHWGRSAVALIRTAAESVDGQAPREMPRPSVKP